MPIHSTLLDGVYFPGKLVQEKLSHYLDQVEVSIAQQVI
jgi:hypothetical protein